MSARSAISRLWREQIIDLEGPTRSLALIRIGVALCAWARFAREVAPYSGRIHPDQMLTAGAFYLSTTAMLVGFRSQLASALSAGVMFVLYYYYGEVRDDPGSWSAHHTFLLASSALWLSLGPCGDRLSVDRWRASRRGEVAPATRPLWALRLLALQVSAVYFWSAVQKTSYVWTSGARLEAALRHNVFGSDAPPFEGFAMVCAVTATAVLILEYTLSVGLHVRRLQPWLMPLGLALHAGIYMSVPVSTFSAEMFVLYLAFLDPSTVERALEQAGAGASLGARAG